MNKLILLLIFCVSFFCNAKDSLAVAKKKKIIFTQKDIREDTSFVSLKTFEKNFKTKYTEKEFVYEFKSAELNAWDRFKAWLLDSFKSLFNFQNVQSAEESLQIFIRILAVIIVIVVIFMIVKAIMNKEGQWIFGKSSDNKHIEYDQIEKNLHLVDFEKLIQKSIDSDQKRLTIRYYYLWLLKKMSEKQLIEWDIEKTNSDYIYEIKNTEQKEAFAYLSYLYNNIWYGEFDLDQEIFAKSHVAFEKAIQKLDNE